MINGTTMPARNCNAMASGCVATVAGESPRNSPRGAFAAWVFTRGSDSHVGQPRRGAGLCRWICR
jgi:hypothetical protein